MPDKIKTRSARLPGHLIRRLHQQSTKVFTDRVKDAGFDLTPIQFVALDALSENEGIDQAGLAEAIAKDRATTGAVADRLEQKGLMSRDVSPRDRWARTLTLTPQGRHILAAMTPVVSALQADILPGLTDEEYRQFVTLAEKATRAQQ